MHITPLTTGILHPGDDLAGALRAACEGAMTSEGCLVVSSKAVAVCTGNVRQLADVTLTPPALEYAKKTGRSPAFMQAVLDECERLCGTVRGWCPGALLTEVRPAGMQGGSLFTANAGMDESNVPAGTTVGWPADPAAEAKNIWLTLGLPVIISDSVCTPRRRGVTAVALAYAGMRPLQSAVGVPDLFGRPLTITTEALADQLATAANAAMGNAGQSTPAALVTSVPLTREDAWGWVPGIAPEEDLFAGALVA